MNKAASGALIVRRNARRRHHECTHKPKPLKCRFIHRLILSVQTTNPITNTFAAFSYFVNDAAFLSRHFLKPFANYIPPTISPPVAAQQHPFPPPQYPASIMISPFNRRSSTPYPNDYLCTGTKRLPALSSSDEMNDAVTTNVRTTQTFEVSFYTSPETIRTNKPNNKHVRRIFLFR